jgi:histidine triad (HIT) family protein
VFHLHFHIIPRYEGAPLAGHGGARMADTVELAALAKTIAGKIG